MEIVCELDKLKQDQIQHGRRVLVILDSKLCNHVTWLYYFFMISIECAIEGKIGTG